MINRFLKRERFFCFTLSPADFSSPDEYFKTANQPAKTPTASTVGARLYRVPLRKTEYWKMLFY